MECPRGCVSPEEKFISRFIKQEILLRLDFRREKSPVVCVSINVPYPLGGEKVRIFFLYQAVGNRFKSILTEGNQVLKTKLGRVILEKY